MTYPVWHLAETAGGFWVAVIAVFHVLIAHLAVGSGTLLVLAELVARNGAEGLTAGFKSRIKGFMMLTLVPGAVSGVGLWFVIGLTAPAATGFLISQFAFIWAAEWVFFLVEITALLAYVYGFNRLSEGNRLGVAVVYAVAGTMSMVLINGILGMMLTPPPAGAHGFPDTFFTASFWPATLVRMGLSICLAGCAALAFLPAKNPPGMDRFRKLVSWLTAASALAALGGGMWLANVLPAPTGVEPLDLPRMQRFAVACGLAALAGVLTIKRLPGGAVRLAAVTGLALSLLALGSFESLREGVRKPWLIPGHIYANGLTVSETNMQTSFLAASPWSRSSADTGRELYQLQCASCHSLDGPMNPMGQRLGSMTRRGLEALLNGLHLRNSSMPPFAGSAKERQALAAFLAPPLEDKPSEAEFTAGGKDIVGPKAGFDPDSGEYVLTAAFDNGMYFTTGRDSAIAIPSRPQILRAQLLLRGEAPERLSNGVELTYRAGDTTGSLTWDDEAACFLSADLGVVPTDGENYVPYTVVEVTAKDESGQELTRTQTLLAVSSELGCRNCHGGPWLGTNSGVGRETARNILQLHNLRHHTELAEGGSAACLDCHGRYERQDDGPMTLSASLHGAHALYLRDEGVRACQACHASKPQGPGKTSRGVHAIMGVDCTRCHGDLQRHAAGLLAAESGSPGLLALLSPESRGVPPRTPWMQEPRCLSCHGDGYQKPGAEASAVGSWADDGPLYAHARDDMDAMACTGCHGSPHVNYPAMNPLDKHADNLQPLQYQGKARALGAGGRCGACHTVDIDFDAHHMNTVRASKDQIHVPETVRLVTPPGYQRASTWVESFAYPHGKHASKINCTHCHHQATDALTGRYLSCSACHSSPDMEHPRGYYKTWHGSHPRSCIGCHSRMRTQGGIQPLGCATGCHPPRT